jgi:hypothetical protein
MKFKNISVGELYLNRIVAFKTYEGVLEGLPNRILNIELIKYGVERFSNIFSCKVLYLNSTVSLSRPEFDILTNEKLILEEVDNDQFEILPNITCAALLTCYSKNYHNNYSYLGVLWFQNNWPCLIGESIRSLDIEYSGNMSTLNVESDVSKSIETIDWIKNSKQVSQEVYDL